MKTSVKKRAGVVAVAVPELVTSPVLLSPDGLMLLPPASWIPEQGNDVTRKKEAMRVPRSSITSHDMEA